MKVRYKQTGTECWSFGFNLSSLCEILTGDDSAYMADLDVWLPALNEWKDLGQAFRDRDVITNNLNTTFFPPPTEDDRKRGFTLT